MNTKPGLTLADIRKSPKLMKTSRASDFMSKDRQEELHIANMVGNRSSDRKFDDTDGYCAEIMARFGYEAYRAWNDGDIEPELMAKMIEAERARERAQWIPLETIIINMVGACIKRNKGEPQPKGPKAAQKVMKAEIKAAKGEA